MPLTYNQVGQDQGEQGTPRTCTTNVPSGTELPVGSISSPPCCKSASVNPTLSPTPTRQRERMPQPTCERAKARGWGYSKHRAGASAPARGRELRLQPVHLRGAGKVAKTRGHQHHDVFHGDPSRESCYFLPKLSSHSREARTADG
jgi:hypothetical protein